MARATYLHPEIVDGRANGRFHLVKLNSGQSSRGTAAASKSGADGLAVALIGSGLLWFGIALLVL